MKPPSGSRVAAVYHLLWGCRPGVAFQAAIRGKGSQNLKYLILNSEAEWPNIEGLKGKN